MIIFAAIFAVTCLGRRLLRFHWLGVGVCVLGVATVGVASIFDTQHSSGPSASSSAHASTDVAFGIAVILFGQVMQAAQMVLEEWLLKTICLSGMHIIGWEGAWGCVILLFIAFPIVYILPGQDHGHMEDFQDTLVMLANSSALRVVVLTYTISCAFYNIFGISVTGALSSVHRTMLEASRSLVVWAVALLVHYKVDSQSRFGEAWTNYSYLQLAGFCLLIFGQAIYGGVIKLPWMYYPDPEDTEVEVWKSPVAEQWLSPVLPKHLACAEQSAVNLL